MCIQQNISYFCQCGNISLYDRKIVKCKDKDEKNKCSDVKCYEITPIIDEKCFRCNFVDTAINKPDRRSGKKKHSLELQGKCSELDNKSYSLPVTEKDDNVNDRILKHLQKRCKSDAMLRKLEDMRRQEQLDKRQIENNRRRKADKRWEKAQLSHQKELRRRAIEERKRQMDDEWYVGVMKERKEKKRLQLQLTKQMYV